MSDSESVATDLSSRSPTSLPAPCGAGRRWQVIGTNILIEPLGENEFAVFNGQHWDSSLLNAVDVCLLQLLITRNGESVCEETLIGEMASELDLPVDETLRHYCRESLSQQAHVGLIFQGAAS